jgi:hypothetical protein
VVEECQSIRQVLECGGPPPLFPAAYQTVPMLTGTAIFEDENEDENEEEDEAAG